MKECFRTKGRELYADREDPDTITTVFRLESGERLNTATLEPFSPGARWTLLESHIDPAVYTLLAKWSDKWGDECIATFKSPKEADDYRAAWQISHWTIQRVRIATEDY